MSVSFLAWNLSVISIRSSVLDGLFKSSLQSNL